MASENKSVHEDLEFAQCILDTLQDPLVVLNDSLRVVAANRTFYRTFQVSPSETVGRFIFELGNGQWNIPDLRKQLDQVLSMGSMIEAFEVNHEFLTIGFKSLLLNAQEVLLSYTTRKTILLAMKDITTQKSLEEELRRLALTDALTGLANRNVFNSTLEKALRSSRRFNYGTALLMLDLDKFKSVNDTHGHPVGDDILKAAANILNDGLREVDLVARLGGDEFAIILEGVNKKDDAELLAQRYIDTLGRPFEIKGLTIRIGTSVGIAHYPDDADNLADLVRRADLALYKAKEAGRNAYRAFTAEMEG
jgi:diguanylate cyclase (GGDEF)-like protein